MKTESKNIPTIIVVFGATGDLMSKKIIPALSHLFRKNKLPQLLKIIGFSRRKISDDNFRKDISSIANFPNKDFLNLFSYHQGLFDKPIDYKNLAECLSDIDQEWGVCSNKLFYLAVPPEYYETIFNHLSSSGLTIPCGPKEGWTRVIVEKPFGKDLKTARRLDELLGRLFEEEQIYRLDHYLAKEMLQNILTFRFANNLFEKNWNSKLVDSIHIKLLEKIGVEDRGGFYDGLGALRDVGQNHLLQMLALATMDQPEDYEAKTIRLKRAQILEQIKIFTAKEASQNSFRAQYKNYEKIDGVKNNSDTETYFKLKLLISDGRWRRLPVYLESGKRMGKSHKEIIVNFKNSANKIIFTIEPTESIKITFCSKKPGLTMEVEERVLHFSLRPEEKKSQYVEEYERLLLDCIIGDQTLFISTEEIRAMWKAIDPFVVAWQKNLVPLASYNPDSDQITKEAKLAGDSIVEKREIGIIGLGKMGKNIALNLINKNWQVFGFNRTAEVTNYLAAKGLKAAHSINELTRKLSKSRVVWLMLPAGRVIDEIIFDKKNGFIQFLDKGDVIVDGSNSFYKDTIGRHRRLKEKGISLLDVGVSGGPEGALNGPALMVGGERSAFEGLEHLFIDLAGEGGLQFFEGAGAGHFVKMIHNGIEYGMMQAIAEGFNILKKSSYHLNLNEAADVYNRGSVIESRLVHWLQKGLKLHGQELEDVSGRVAHTGEGEWTVKTAKEMKLQVKIIEEAFKFRVMSEKNPSYTGKILSVLREQFGGHSIK